ncbi:MAG: hypothetical protein OXF66_02570 [Gammaproteobacteria bacterium]|nr:hypothetical protein [Gammaproteobacteria bacterium]MCY4341744.1 hypothetical protein [Gammaproteobacteria bacterium]
MDFDREWTANEDGLLREADSLAALLARIGGCFPPVLIRGEGWRRLLDQAAGLPASLAAFPMWMGFSMRGPRPAADLAVSLVGGSRSAVFFQDESAAGKRPSCAAAVASLLKETAPDKAPLRRIAGNRVLLDYSMDSMRRARRSDPGIFLYPIKRTLPGGARQRRPGNLGVVLDAILRAMDWERDSAERRNAEQVYSALKRDTRIAAVGVFPSRGKGIRLMALGFGEARAAAEFAQRAGWPGRHSALAAILSRLEQCGALDGMRMGVDLQASAQGVGPSLDLHIFSENTIYESAGWFKDPQHWDALIDGMREEGLIAAEKSQALAEWSSGAEMLFGKSGPFVLLRRLHHVKLVMAEERLEQINAYVFMLMGALPRNSG